jgi:hypothetical protein
MAERLSRPARTILALERRADRPWFLPAVSIFPLTDYVLPFLPNQMLLVGLSMTLPRRWLALAVSFVVATGLGAMLAALAIQHWGGPLIAWAFGGQPDASAAAPVIDAVRLYGLFALAGFAMLPWPPRTAVIVCAIAGLSPLLMGVAVAVGRIVPALAYAGIGAYAPDRLRRIRAVDQVMCEIERERDRMGAAPS